MNAYTMRQKEMINELERSFQSGNVKSTIVDMQSDYENDRQLCLAAVVFPPSHLAEEIEKKIIQPLREIEPFHYYYPAESLHLTVKNVRTISDPPLFTENDAQNVRTLFSNIIPQFSAFEYSLQDVLAFPTSSALMAYCDDTLQSIVMALDQGLKDIGVPDNKTYLSNEIFWGNCTFCRFVRKPSEGFYSALNAQRETFIGTFKAETISLITCNAGCSSSSKRIIGEFKLKT